MLLEKDALIDLFISYPDEYKYCHCFYDHLIFTTSKEISADTKSCVDYIDGRGTSFQGVLCRDDLFIKCKCSGIVRFVNADCIYKPNHCHHCGRKIK